MACSAPQELHTAKLCTKNTGAKAEALEVLGQKPFALQVTHSYTGSNVNLHEWRQLEIVAWTDRSMADKKTGRQTDR